MREAEGQSNSQKHIHIRVAVGMAVALALITMAASASQDRHSLKVPGGLSFAEFAGYETWQVVSLSHNGDKLAVILGNPALIEAFRSGIPVNGKSFPDGVKMAKIHWTVSQKTTYPGAPLVAGPLHDVDFMVKDSRRFADSGGWGYGAFEFDATVDGFRPANTSDSPPQGNDAKCGFACHTVVKNRDYVFTEFARR